MDRHDPTCTQGLRFYQWMMDKDRHSRLANQRRLRELRDQQGDSLALFCSHDVLEFERLSGRSARVPAEAMARAVASMDARREATIDADTYMPPAGDQDGEVPHPAARHGNSRSPRTPTAQGRRQALCVRCGCNRRSRDTGQGSPRQPRTDFGPGNLPTPPR